MNKPAGISPPPRPKTIMSGSAAGPRTTYFSSEKPGRIQGFEALMEHHRGFGFVPGGKTADNRLWLEDDAVWEDQGMAFVTARWLFDRDVAAQVPVQKGPVTFVLIRGDDGFRIVHAHFANDPAAPIGSRPPAKKTDLLLIRTSLF
jgi:hypothetical protein